MYLDCGCRRDITPFQPQLGRWDSNPLSTMAMVLQTTPALQLRRSPLITPYRPTDKTCQIFSFPLEGNMLYRHLHQKVFWTGVYLCSTALLHFLAFLATEVFDVTQVSPPFHVLATSYTDKGMANELIFYPLSGLVFVYKPTNSPSFF